MHHFLFCFLDALALRFGEGFPTFILTASLLVLSRSWLILDVFDEINDDNGKRGDGVGAGSPDTKAEPSGLKGAASLSLSAVFFCK